MVSGWVTEAAIVNPVVAMAEQGGRQGLWIFALAAACLLAGSALANNEPDFVEVAVEAHEEAAVRRARGRRSPAMTHVSPRCAQVRSVDEAAAAGLERFREVIRGKAAAHTTADAQAKVRPAAAGRGSAWLTGSPGGQRRRGGRRGARALPRGCRREGASAR